MTQQHFPRLPNAEEQRELVHYYLRQIYGKKTTAQERQEAEKTVATAWIAVFDDFYQYRAPNNQGRMMFVNWDVDLCNYEVFAWTRQGRMESIRQCTRDYPVF